MTSSGMHDERDLVRWLKSMFSETGPAVQTGIGDDAAILETGGSEPLAATVDTLVDGIHFLSEDTDPVRVGRKAAAVSLSDLAAVGGDPVAMLVSAGFSAETEEAWIQELFRGIQERTEMFSCDVIGGDLTETGDQLVVSTVALGVCVHGPVLRSGASPGDLLYVTGTLGGSLGGRHLDFTPRVTAGKTLAEWGGVTAMIDLSDGLAVDLDRLLEESGVAGAVLRKERLPVHPDVREEQDGEDRSPVDRALHDGEDFELLFAVSPRDEEAVEQLSLDVSVTWIGTLQAEEGLFLEAEDGTRQPIDPEGYLHFSGQ